MVIMKKITVINPRYRKHYIKQLPNQFNHLFLSYDQALIQKDPQRLRKRLWTFYQTLLGYPHLHLLKPVKDHLNTSQQLLNMLDVLDQYQIDLNTLPEDRLIEKEKKQILLWMDTLDLYRPYKQPKALPFNRLEVTANLYPPDQYDVLKQHPQIELKTIEPSFKAAFHALNPSQEIESVAQYIQQHQLQNVLILHGSLDEAALDFLRYFTQYQLDFDLSYQTDNVTNQIYVHLVNCALEPSVKSLIDVLSFFPFGQNQAQQDLITYLQRYQPSWQQLSNLEVIKKQPSLQQVDEHQYQTLLRLEISAQQALDEVFTHLEKLDPHQPLTSSFEVLTHTTQDPTAILSLKHQLEALFDDEPETIDIMILEGLLAQKQSHHIAGEQIIIARLEDIPPMNFDTIILMGLTKSTFPINRIYHGFFDELYARKIAGFPSLADRQELLDHQIKTLFTSSRQLIYSSHRINVDGANIDHSFELDQQLQAEGLTWQDWPYHQQSGKSLHIQNLKPEIIDRLVFKNGHLQGSVSSFETYFNSSYQFFIEYLLYVQKPRELTTDVAFVGTIAHEVLAKLLEDYGQDYLSVEASVINGYLQIYESLFKQLYPTKQAYYSQVFNLIGLNLLDTSRRLAQITPLSSKFEPLESEHHFVNQQGFDQDNLIKLNGYIDRIDQSEQGLIILDYKSSNKTLSASSIYNGQQLQLILYGVIASRTFGLPLLGVYYVSLQNSLESIELIKHGKRPYQFNLNKLLASKQYKLAGFTFQPNPLEGYVTPSHQKSLEEIMEVYQERFKEMIESLKQGQLDTNRQDDQYFSLKNLQRYKESSIRHLTKVQRDDVKMNAYSFKASLD